MPQKKKGKRKGRKGPYHNTSRPLLLKEEEGQEYARASKMLGDRRVECECYDGRVRVGHIRGKMRKRAWVNVGDVVLITLRDFQDDKCDIIHTYFTDEVKKLTKLGYLPAEEKEEEEVDVLFVDEKEEKEEEIVFDEI